MTLTLPNLIVIGAMKCGTSSLHRYLDLHPQIAMSARKELDYFIPAAPDDPKADPDRPLRWQHSNWDRGLAWYGGHFDDAVEVRGESSVAYLFPWYPDVAERIATTLPSVRLIAVLRHPLDRAISHHRQFADRDRRDLTTALSADASPYVSASRYATALEPFSKRFDADRLLLIRHRDLLQNRRATLSQVFSFLGVEAGFWRPEMERERNRSAVKGRAYRVAEQLRAGPLGPLADRLPAEMRDRGERLLARSDPAPPPDLDAGVAERLLDDLEPEIAAVEGLTGWDLSDWRQPSR